MSKEQKNGGTATANEAMPAKTEPKKKEGAKRNAGKYANGYDFTGIMKLYPKIEDLEENKDLKRASQVKAILRCFHGKGKLTESEVDDTLSKFVKGGHMRTTQDHMKVFVYYRNVGVLKDHGVAY